MRQRLAAMTQKEHDRASEKIRLFLQQWSVWQKAQNILGFYPMRSEPIWMGQEIDLTKRFAFPRILRDELVFFQESEEIPMALDEVDLILIPGLAFDRWGVRLGRGGGYFDRFLARWNGFEKRPLFVAIAFACQWMKVLPREFHDVAMDRMVTEEGLVFPQTKILGEIRT